MATLFCTAKYRELFDLPDRREPAAETLEGALGPWHANTLSISQQRFLHYMSARTLLPVVITLRERATAEERMRRQLAELLRLIGTPAAVVYAELEAVTSFEHVRASDRSRLASMRDQTRTAKDAVHYRGARSPLDIALDLAYMPTGAIAYATPSEAALKALLAHHA